MNTFQDKEALYNEEIRLLTEKKERYLDIMMQQADTIRDLKALVKVRDYQILDLQNKLTEESNI